jgi:hypothetical protein
MATIPGLGVSFSLGQIAQAGGVLLGGPQRAASYTGNRAVPNESLGLDAYCMLMRLGYLSPQAFNENLLDLGYPTTPMNRAEYRLMKYGPNGILVFNDTMLEGEQYHADRLAALSKNLPGPDEVLLMLNRGIIDKGLAEVLIEIAYGGETFYAKEYLKLADQIPGPTDLISFAVRDVFSNDIVTTFEYNKELPSAILPWMAKQGLAGKTGQPMPANSTTTEGDETRTETQWFDYYWWSHWQLPGVSQGFEMLQRLYSTSRYGPAPTANTNTYFDKPALELLQKANDFPPYWRERLQAISYNPISRMDIKRLYNAGILKEDADNHDVYHAYRANGYNDSDAYKLTQYALKTVPKDIQDLALQQVDKLYKLGALDVSDVSSRLAALYYRPEQIAAHITQLDLEITTDEIKHNLDAAKKAFLAGDFSLDNLRSFLTTAGITPIAQSRYLREWQVELQTSRRHISASEAIRMYKSGTLALVALQTRLTNLNYPPLEIIQIIGDANASIIIKQAKAELAAIKQGSKPLKAVKPIVDKAALQAAKAKAKTQADAVKEEAKVAKAERGAFSETNLKAFAKAGLITKANLEKVLADKGWLSETIVLWIEAFAPKLK